MNTDNSHTQLGTVLCRAEGHAEAPTLPTMTDTEITHAQLRTLEDANNPAADVARLILIAEGRLPESPDGGTDGQAATVDG